MASCVNTPLALSLLKIALGITHDHRDDYFTKLLNSRALELSGRGVDLDPSSPEDTMLLVDYAEWCYRNRDGVRSLPENIAHRIANKKARGRLQDAE